MWLKMLWQGVWDNKKRTFFVSAFVSHGATLFHFCYPSWFYFVPFYPIYLAGCLYLSYWGSSTADAYAVFAVMLKNGNLLDNWAKLKKVAKNVTFDT